EKDGRPNNTDHQKLCVEIASLYTLTNREKDILILLADRYNSNDIAEKLVLSVHTVKTHMKNLYAKLGVHSQKDLIALVESLNDGKPLF
ncbi:MAG: helix-turn-helix transcriptional regulator, partial [Raoultibacter sp.]